MADNKQGNPNFQLALSLVGVVPSGAFMFTDIHEETAVRVQFEDVQEVPSASGNVLPNIRYDLICIEEGQYKGAKLGSVYLGTDLSKEGNKRHWKALLQSVFGEGFPPLEAGAVTISRATFMPVGQPAKTAWIYNKPRGEGEIPDKRFITASEAQKVRADVARRPTASTPMAPTSHVNAPGMVAAPSAPVIPPSPPANLNGAPAPTGGIPQPPASLPSISL